MKQITITLLLFTIVLSVSGQESTVNYIGPKPVPAGKNFTFNNRASGTEARANNTSYWLNYPAALEDEIGGLTGYIAPLFSDSSVYFSYGTDYGKAEAYGISQIFNAYSTYFALANGINLPSSEGYTLDSISVAAAYTRLVTDTSEGDTLLINLFQGAPQSAVFPYAYFYSVPDTYWINHFNADTVFFPEMFYSPQTFGAGEWYYGSSGVNATITTIRVPLHQVDTEAVHSGFNTAVPGGMQVAAGNLVGMTVAFKPGFTYHAGDTASLHYNTFEYLSDDENNTTGEPLYTPNDNNFSFIVPQDVQYNQSVGQWDSLYIPTIAFLPGFQLQDNAFSYHITFTTGVQDVSSIISGQSIYPNPASDMVTLNYTLKANASVIINVYNITGKLIHSRNVNANEGLNQQLMNTQNLTDGLYMVSVEANGVKSVSTLVVAR